MNKLVIAIDGHAACGKSSTAKALAASLGYTYIDTGAMYRAVTFYFIRNRVHFDDEEEVSSALEKIKIDFQNDDSGGSGKVLLNGKDVTKDIRSMQVTRKVSEVSAIVEVRRFLVKAQQDMGKGGGIVMDGRDIGTVVFPNADLKIYMTADIVTRAKRRQEEMEATGQHVDLDAIVENLQNRDYMDSNRKEGPLRKAADAIVVDTTHTSFDQQKEVILKLAKEKIAAAPN